MAELKKTKRWVTNRNIVTSIVVDSLPIEDERSVMILEESDVVNSTYSPEPDEWRVTAN